MLLDKPKRRQADDEHAAWIFLEVNASRNVDERKSRLTGQRVEDAELDSGPEELERRVPSGNQEQAL